MYTTSKMELSHLLRCEQTLYWDVFSGVWPLWGSRYCPALLIPACLLSAQGAGGGWNRWSCGAVQEWTCGSSAGPEPSRVGSCAELCAEQGQRVHSAQGSSWNRGEWAIPAAIAACWAQVSAGQDFPLLWVLQSLPASHWTLPGNTFLPQCLEEPEDLVARYLRSLCRSPLICRPILLDFSLDRKPSKILQPGKQVLLAFLIFKVGRKEGRRHLTRLGKERCLHCSS